MKVGQYNTLKVLRGTSVGMYLGDEEDNDVLLPHKYIPDTAAIGQDIEVFIYRDSEDRLIATTLRPLIELNGFACLEIVGVSAFGAFADWGLEKDLFIPFREQQKKLKTGDWVVIYLYLDETTDRLVGSCKIHRYFKNDRIENLEPGQEADLLVFEKTDLGLNVVINNLYKGLIYHNEIFKRVAWGDQIKGYIKTIREDGKIDVSLQKLGFREIIEPNSAVILEKLKQEGGILQLSDHSDPQEIMEKLEMSKKNFKKALGNLYKQKLISLDEHSVRLL